MATPENKALKQLLADLRSDNESTVLDALERTRSIGTRDVTPLLLDLMLHTNHDIQINAERIILSLKDSASAEVLADAIQQDRYQSIRAKIISAFWQSGLDASPYLTPIIKAAIEGDFLVCMECYSVIDNLQDKELPGEQVMECLELLNAYFATRPSDQKSALMKDITEMLQRD